MENQKVINRKDFFKKTCLASACFCGFVPMASSSANREQMPANNESDNSNTELMQDWIANLLLSIEENSTRKVRREIIKTCAQSHYNSLNMDKLLAPYVGNIEEFIRFLSNEWGWEIDFDSVSGILTANENKSYCVCPLINHNNENKFPALCYCSEGFAEEMFSRVLGYPVTARVVSSIQKGDDQCIYEVGIKEKRNTKNKK